MNKEKFFYLNDLYYEKFDKYALYLERVIYTYAIFDGFPKKFEIDKKYDIYTLVLEYILKDYNSLKGILGFDSISNDEYKLLERIAIGDRKAFTALKKENISQFNGSQYYLNLVKNKILIKEYSREKPIKKVKFIPKEYRKYKIQNKYKFTSSFYRFWFNFIEPNKHYIEEKEYNIVLKKIEKHFESFVSFTFEELSAELIKVLYEDVNNISSYWDKNIEIDLLCNISNDMQIVGECKWKNHKISKNILNSLIKKSQISNLEVDKYALFSKSGFSKELLNNQNENILLFDLKSFKRLVDGK
jgi:hypothetical protein